MANETAADVLTDERIEALKTIATSTLAHQLQMRGIRSTFFSGLKPLHPELRMVGRARTLRYVALREDLQQQYGGGMNAQRRAVESLKPGDVLVIEARGVPDAATIGDIFSTRAFKLGATGIVTDGALRDTPAIAELHRPVYHFASHGATLGRQHMPFSVDEPVTCAGVFVVPGDVIVGDGEGAVVIPVALVADVVRDALVQEERERFALERVAAGESTVGLFPLSKERTAEFEQWAADRKDRKGPPIFAVPSKE
jgi:5-oxopent-3-ene-1,2,5-tricarboxylate decarboxylase / 2-hydroxyhepta-2,4-diene-1,7-dioate isomerase